jgi:hypothetical protein
LRGQADLGTLYSGLHHTRLPMLYNRSVPPCAVIPVLFYPSPVEASDLAGEGVWLHRPTADRESPHPVRAGEGCITLAEGTIKPNHSCTVQVRVSDARAHCERARRAGANILSDVKDQVYGERQYVAEHFHGHKWNFTETFADIEPESWGGTSVDL